MATIVSFDSRGCRCPSAKGAPVLLPVIAIVLLIILRYDVGNFEYAELKEKQNQL
jgi:hypothetical protein